MTASAIRTPVVPCTPERAQWFHHQFRQLTDNIELAVLGKTPVVKLALAVLCTGGHLLLEDNPGTGKTMLAKAIARSIRGDHKRIQFTPDLMPSEITGGLINHPRDGLILRRGPVFTNVLIADEINRASPKTQSALLQAMEEREVTLDLQDERLPDPFMVIATQNPIEQAGTYPLPEAQLDRFLVRTQLGDPDPAAALHLLSEASEEDRSALVREDLATLKAVTDMRDVAKGVHVDPAVQQYAYDIVRATHAAPEVRIGVSMRGALALVRLAKTWAVAHGKHYVIPDDMFEIGVAVLAHRLVPTLEAEIQDVDLRAVMADIIRRVPAPGLRAAA